MNSSLPPTRPRTRTRTDRIGLALGVVVEVCSLASTMFLFSSVIDPHGFPAAVDHAISYVAALAVAVALHFGAMTTAWQAHHGTIEGPAVQSRGYGKAAFRVFTVALAVCSTLAATATMGWTLGALVVGALAGPTGPIMLYLVIGLPRTAATAGDEQGQR